MTNSEHSQSNPSSIDSGATQYASIKRLDQQSIKNIFPKEDGETAVNYATRIMVIQSKARSVGPCAVFQAQGQKITTSGGFVLIQGSMFIRTIKKDGSPIIISYEKAGESGSLYFLSPETKITPLELYSGSEGAWVAMYTPDEVRVSMTPKKVVDGMTDAEIEVCKRSEIFPKKAVQNAEATLIILCQKAAEKLEAISIKPILHLVLKSEEAKNGKIVFVKEFGALMSRFNIKAPDLITPESYASTIYAHCVAHPELEKEFMDRILETFYKFRESVAGASGYDYIAKLADLDKSIRKLANYLAS